MQYHIETERLLLKPVAPEDVSAMFIWTSDPEVNPYRSDPLHHDVSVMQKWIASLRPENLKFGFYRSEDGLLSARAVSVNAAMGFIIWATTSAAICGARGMPRRQQRRCFPGDAGRWGLTTLPRSMPWKTLLPETSSASADFSLSVMGSTASSTAAKPLTQRFMNCI